MKIFVTCHLIVVEIFGDFGTDFLMTIQLVPNCFQINCSQNVKEAGKINGTIFYLKQFISKKMGAEVQNP